VPYAISFLAGALLERGEFDEAAGVIASAGLPDELPVSVHLFFFQLARGRLAVMTRVAGARVADLLELGRRTQLVSVRQPADYPVAALSRARGSCCSGATTRRARSRDEELAIARPLGCRRRSRRAACARQRVGGEEGEALLREAVESPRPRRPGSARTGARRPRRRPPARQHAREARDTLRRGRELAYRAGRAALVERANEELAATGARPRKARVGGVDALTASERRVARAGAQEMTNKEIAQALFVTVKTVEVHLSSVYRKLAIASRRSCSSPSTRAADRTLGFGQPHPEKAPAKDQGRVWGRPQCEPTPPAACSAGHSERPKRRKRDDRFRPDSREPGHRRAAHLPRDGSRHRRRVHALRGAHRAGGSCRRATCTRSQSERFEILSGSLTMTIGSRKLEAKPGDVVVIEPATPHNFWNKTTSGPVLVEVRSGARHRVAPRDDVRARRRRQDEPLGDAEPFRLAVIANEHFDVVRVPLVPSWAQRAALAVGARSAA
jgi:DNA-binding CsgD family transcriptional regulator/mannose-6-phosphate isomerase-like protein (cupin superfamily)